MVHKYLALPLSDDRSTVEAVVVVLENKGI